MKVLLVGVGESYHIGAFFRRALEELGHDVVFVDEGGYVTNRAGEALAYRLFDKKPLRYRSFNRDLVNAAAKFQPDVLLATKGSFIAPEALAELKRRTAAVLINYATDDPFNRRTSGRHLVNAIRYYDLYVCTKRAIMQDVRLAGSPNAVFIPFGYEPSMHYPEQPLTDEDKARYSSDVAFIGGADPDRYPFFEALLDAMPELNLHLYGGYWDRHPRLKKYHRGFAIGREYRLVIAGTKIAPCLVRRANRDGHVMRTFEIPACGGFMLHERTPELLELYDEGKEVACFRSPQELAEKVQYYLAHPAERDVIARASYARCVPAYSYDNRLRQVLGRAENLAMDQAEAALVSN
ncbi:MAG TPA: glycosyltransferase [Terriglobales bacterium]|nr:glycosyltransferase [Terriglobales bacterium]